jgi:hypothetical protein
MPLSLEYRIPEEDLGFGFGIESRNFSMLIGVTTGDDGLVKLVFERGLVGGKLVTRAAVRGGCGKAAIDTARLGSFGVSFIVTDASKEGVEDRSNAIPDGGRILLPEIDLLGVCGRADSLRKPCIEFEFGSAGSADVGGFEALKERGVRGAMVVVTVAIAESGNGARSDRGE